jgi:hypothetical protein
VRRSTRALGAAGVAALILIAALVRDRSKPAPAAPAEAPSRERAAAPTEPSLDPPARAEAPETRAAPEVEPAERLTVLVLDAATELPVAGAQVIATEFERAFAALGEAGLGHETPAGRELRRCFAQVAVTGEDGTAEIEARAQRWMVEARAEGRFDFAMLNSLPEDRRVTLRLEPDESVCVRIVDPSGAPLAGVPVALRRRKTYGPGFDWRLTESEAGSGLARFEHYQRRLRQGPGWHFVFAFPVRGEPAASASHGSCEQAPALALPGSGELAVHVRGPDGEAANPDDVRLVLAAFEDERETPLCDGGPWSRPALDARGDARVPWIGLGLRVRIELCRGEDPIAAATFDGPARDGEVVACELRWSADALPPRRFVTGRFVLSDGSAWPAARVTAQALVFPAPQPYPAAHELEVEAGGRFRLEVRDALPRGGSRRLRIAGDHPAGLGSVLAFVPLDFEVPEGGHELGDVLLDHGPLLAEGRVVDELGRPIAGATTYVQARSTAGGEGLWPRWPSSGIATTGADGRFALYLPSGEDPPAGQVRLEAVAPEHSQREQPEFAFGASGLEVVLERAGWVAGSLVLAPEIRSSEIVLVLRGPEDVSFQARDSGEFTSRPVLPGSYGFRVLLRSEAYRARHELTFEGIVVVPGETCRDPRLQGIEVASPSPVLAITVVDRSSAPIAGATAALAGRPYSRLAIAGSDGVCRLPVAALPADVAVTAFGFREQVLAGLASDARVVLDEGLLVRLRAGAPAAETRSPYALFVLLYRVGDDGVARETIYRDAFPVERRRFDGEGELALHLPGPGVYECSLHVSVLRADHVGSGAPVELSPRPRFTVRELDLEQVFELDVPAEAIARAVERANG